MGGSGKQADPRDPSRLTQRHLPITKKTFTRGALVGAGFEGTVQTAVVAMLALAGVGLIVGQIAEATVDESIRQRLQTQIEQHEEMLKAKA